MCAPGAGARAVARKRARRLNEGERERDLSETERERGGGGDRRWKLCELCERESVCLCVLWSRSVTMISLYSLLSTSQCDLTTQTATLRLLIKLTPLLVFLLLLFLGFFFRI